MFFSLAASITATIGIFLAIRVLIQDRKALLNRAMFVTIIISAVFTFIHGIIAGSSNPQAISILIKICCTIHVFFLLGTMVCLFIYARPAWYWFVIYLMIHLVYDVGVLSAIWQNQWVITGYTPTPYGNALILTTDQFWLQADRVRGLFDTAIGVLLLIKTFKKTKSRKNKLITVSLLIIIFAVTILTLWLKIVVWLEWGYPDYSPLLAIITYLAYFALIKNYSHFQENKPNLQDKLLSTLNKGYLFMNMQGEITKTSDLIGNIFGEKKIINQSLLGVFPQWDGLAEKWQQLSNGDESEISNNFYINEQLYNVKISACKDKFSDIEGFIVHFKLLSQLEAFSKKFGLTTREKEVFQCMLDSDDNKTIADQLFISPATVKNHLHNIYRKTETQNRTDILKLLLNEQIN
ncbi:MAG: hypothetical protein JXR63_03025 [Spirochaetales bacterium]|nr:hypothetical protein [Spirochaetales bacterium]